MPNAAPQISHNAVPRGKSKRKGETKRKQRKRANKGKQGRERESKSKEQEQTQDKFDKLVCHNFSEKIEYQFLDTNTKIRDQMTRC